MILVLRSMDKMLENKGYVANVKAKIERNAVYERILINKQPGRILKRRLTSPPRKSILRRRNEQEEINHDLNVPNEVIEQEMPHSNGQLVVSGSNQSNIPSRPMPRLLLLNKVKNAPFSMVGRRRKSCDIFPTTAFQGKQQLATIFIHFF